MAIGREIARRGRQVVGPVLGFLVASYFVYHSVEGERGLVAYARYAQEVTQARAHLDEISAERRALERRVNLLRAESLDPDLLDERARLILNLARPDEVIVVDPVTSRR